MKHAQVKIIHVKDGNDIEGMRSRTARIFINGVEIEGLTSYLIAAGMDYGSGGVVQKMTLEFFAEVEIDQVKR